MFGYRNFDNSYYDGIDFGFVHIGLGFAHIGFVHHIGLDFVHHIGLDFADCTDFADRIDFGSYFGHNLHIAAAVVAVKLIFTFTVVACTSNIDKC